MINQDLRLDSEGWVSRYESVNNLLKHLKRKTQSEASRQIYLATVNRFCNSLGIDPDTIVTWDKKKIEQAIQNFCDELKISPNTRNIYMSNLIMFFYANGFKVGKRPTLELESYHVPSRHRERPEYIPTQEEIEKMINVSGASLRNRLALLLIYTSGLRNSTARALRWQDLDLEGDEDKPLLIRVTSKMKEVVSDACKNLIPYYTFCSSECIRAFKRYREQAKSRYGDIQPGQIVFMSEGRLLSDEQRRFQPIDKSSFISIIRAAAKNAGIKDWKQVHPHCLRKAFETCMRNAGLDVKTQEFLMGHILAGSQDSYYDSSKTNELREKYSKITFFHTEDKKISDLQSQLYEAQEQIRCLKEENYNLGNSLRAQVKDVLKRINELENR